jgi:hypothetical protein
MGRQRSFPGPAVGSENGVRLLVGFQDFAGVVHDLPVDQVQGKLPVDQAVPLAGVRREILFCENGIRLRFF